MFQDFMKTDLTDKSTDIGREIETMHDGTQIRRTVIVKSHGNLDPANLSNFPEFGDVKRTFISDKPDQITESNETLDDGTKVRRVTVSSQKVVKREIDSSLLADMNDLSR